MRKSEITRKTTETDIALKLCLDGRGGGRIDTGVGFLDHMLTLFAKHGQFDLEVSCVGDTQVDAHHTVEDVGICLGAAFAQALGDLGGIARYGSAIIPMDEALILTAVDISGRGWLSFDLQLPARRVGDFDTELVEEFYRAFVRKANVTLHIRQFSGTNTHHIIEGCFKAFARAMRAAVAIDQQSGGAVPSTKGML